MAVWAGIDEAGYGPQLGPLVVAGIAFHCPAEMPRGDLWTVLREAVVRRARGSDGRLIVNDSKLVYSPAKGLKRLEEGVLAFLQAGGRKAPSRGAELLELIEGGRSAGTQVHPWFEGAAGLSLPLATNASALDSKAAALTETMSAAGVRLASARAAVTLPAEFNRVVARTRNKSLLLFQKAGLVLQELWRAAGPGQSRVLIDKHGGRARYRKLLLDAFPHCRCDILEEGPGRSAYRVADPRLGDRELLIAFQEEGDRHAFPTALASMAAKYVRELYMTAFNAYWQQRMEGLRPTAGYFTDARRFLKDIAPLLQAEGVEREALVRSC
jgi:hypothetical protein